MTAQPNLVHRIPGEQIGDAFMENVTNGNMVNSGNGFEYDDAQGIRIFSEVPFYFALATNNTEGSNKTNNPATRGFRCAGIWTFAYYNELRKLYIRAAGNGVMSFERLKGDSKVVP